MRMQCQSLSEMEDAELLAKILPPIAVHEVMEEYGSIRSFLQNSYPDELTQLKGVGPGKAHQLQYLCELAKRLHQPTKKIRHIIRSPEDVAHYMTDMIHLQQEEFRIILLNTKNQLLAVRNISRGTLHGTQVDPREIFHRAIKMMAAGIVLVHNHPSGDPMPSKEDQEVTRKIVESGTIIGIPILDHIVIGQGEFVSFKERGML